MKNIKLILLIITFNFLNILICIGQNNLCNNALPFCTDTVYNFPAGVNAGSAQSGPNYTCLYTQPNPAWYYLEVLNPGPIIINMTSSPSVDIDFSLWGPFTDPSSPCVAQLTSGNTVDCSYSTSWNETATINNAQTGQVYILLITNYSNQPTNINFHQQNAGQSNAGSTNCGILAPPIDNNGPLCEGETLEITVNNPNPSAAYSWTGPGGFSSNQMNITIPNTTLAHAGQYSLVITVGGQTSAPVTTDVVINPLPNVTLTPFSSICGDVADFALTGGSPAGGTYSGQGVNNNMFSPISVGPGTYTITYDYETPEGCAGSASNTIGVDEDPQIIISNDTSICINNTVTLSASGGTSYIWSNFITTPSITVSPTLTTTYTVTVSNNIGCSSVDNVVVNVNPNPAVTIKPENPNMCAGNSISLVTGGGTTYLWAATPSGATLSGQNTLPLITVSPNATTTYSVTATDDFGCTGTTSAIVTINPNPIASFYASPAVTSILEPYVNFFDNSFGASSWVWLIEDGSQYYVPEFSHVFSDTGTFDVTLWISNQYGCMDSTFGSVYIQPNFTLYIPNTFTPNNDLKNDVFYIYGEGILAMELRIFDRCGKKVFYTDDVHKGWDGKINGNNAPVGVYTYILIYRDGFNKRHLKRGTVTLMR